MIFIVINFVYFLSSEWKKSMSKKICVKEVMISLSYLSDWSPTCIGNCVFILFPNFLKILTTLYNIHSYCIRITLPMDSGNSTEMHRVSNDTSILTSTYRQRWLSKLNSQFITIIVLWSHACFTLPNFQTYSLLLMLALTRNRKKCCLL